MTDAEQVLAIMGGAVLALWGLRHGRLAPSLAVAAAAPLVIAGWRKRWPSGLSSHFGGAAARPRLPQS